MVVALGPRFGFAYSPGATEGILGKIFGGPGKTSIRAGTGLFYNAIQDQTLYWILGTVPFGGPPSQACTEARFGYE